MVYFRRSKGDVAKGLATWSDVTVAASISPSFHGEGLDGKIVAGW
jgi:hypothetical protein